MPNIRREILRGDETIGTLAYITDVWQAASSEQLRYQQTIAVGNGTTYTYPRAMYTYTSIATPETPTFGSFPMYLGQQEDLQLYFDPNNTNAAQTYGFYLIDINNPTDELYEENKIMGILATLDIYYITVYTDGTNVLVYDPTVLASYNGFYILEIAYNENNVLRMIDEAHQNGYSIEPLEIIANYFLAGVGLNERVHSGTRTLSDKQVQVYPPVIYSPIFNLRRGNSEYEWNFKVNHFSYLAPMTSQTTYLFKEILKVQYSVRGDMQQKTVVNIPSFNPATESNSNRYAYIVGNTVSIRDPLLPKLPESGTTIYPNTFPTNTCSFVNIRLNRDVVSELKDKYATTYSPLAYDVNSNASSTDLQILRRQFTLGSYISFQTIYHSGTDLSYLGFYEAANNTLLTENNVFPFIPETTGLCGLNYRATNYALNGTVTTDDTVEPCEQMPSKIMNIFLIKLSSQSLTNQQLDKLSLVTHYANSGTNSSWILNTDLQRDNFPLADYELAYLTNKILPTLCEINETSVVEPQPAIRGFNVTAVPNTSDSHLPGFTLYTLLDSQLMWRAQTASYVTYDFIYNSANGRNMLGLYSYEYRQMVNTNTNVSYFGLKTAYEGGSILGVAYTTNNTNINNVGTATYYLVGANVVVPCWVTTSNITTLCFKKGLLVSPKVIYAKKHSMTGNFYMSYQC